MLKLFIAMSGIVFVMGAPFDGKVKVPIAILTATPGAIGILGEYGKYKNAKTKTEKLLEDAAELTAKSGQDKGAASLEKAKILREADAEKKKILADAEQQRQELLKLAGQKIEELEAAKAELRQQKAEIERLRNQVGEDLSEVEALRKEVELQKAIARNEGLGEAAAQIFQDRQEIDRQLRDLMELEASIKTERLAWLQEQSEGQWTLHQQRQQLEFDVKQSQQTLQFETEEARGQIDRERIEWEAELQKERSELEQLKEDLTQQWAAEFEEYSQETLRKQIEALKANYQETFKKNVDAEVAEALQPYMVEVGKLKQKIEQLQTRNQHLNIKVEQLELPVVPKGFAPAQTMARNLAYFYRDRGIRVDVVTYLQQANNGVTVVILPKDGTVTSIELKKGKALEVMIQEFGLQEPPKLQVVADGFQFEFMPLQQLFNNLPSQISAKDPMMPFYNKSVFPQVLEESEEQQEAYETTARNAAIQELSKAQIESDMQNYHPPTHHFDPNQPLSEAEITYCRWLHDWQKPLLNKPNVTNQNNLIQALWGVTIGYNSDKKLYEGITLRERLHQIYDRLGYSTLVE